VRAILPARLGVSGHSARVIVRRNHDEARAHHHQVGQQPRQIRRSHARAVQSRLVLDAASVLAVTAHFLVTTSFLWRHDGTIRKFHRDG
jgi:hypothetical protein